jgi:iron complex transport system substrate-binding protein
MFRRLTSLLLAMMILVACGGTTATEAPSAVAPTSAPAEPPSAVVESTTATTDEASEPTASATEETIVATSEATTETATTATAEATETTVASASEFPITIEHKFGSTEIAEAPQRVVSLGYTDQDPMLAIGVVPIAVREFFGEQPGAVWPWAQERLGGATPEVLNMPFGELNFEAIAALDPDLIIAVSAGVTDAEYATLAQIAPTVAQSDEYVDFGVPWQEQTRVIGRALGLEARAEELVAQTEARFAEVRAAHPEFEGKTSVIAAPASDGQFFFSGPEHERQRVLTSLGFTLPEELATLAGDAFYGTISGEQLPQLDTDVMVWTISAEQRATLEDNPIYQQLRAVREGRTVFLDTTGASDLVGPALVFSSVLSLPIVFDQLVPQLSAAVDGDLGTSVTAIAAPTVPTTAVTVTPE